MPVEINELIIRATVVEDNDNPGSSDSVLEERIIEHMERILPDYLQRMLQVIERLQER